MTTEAIAAQFAVLAVYPRCKLKAGSPCNSAGAFTALN